MKFVILHYTFIVRAHLIIPYFCISFSPQYWNDAKNTYSHKEYKWQCIISFIIPVWKANVLLVYL